MKTTIFFCAIVLLFSCKPAMTAQENGKKDTIVQTQKPKYEDTFRDQVSPNTVYFEGNIVSLMADPTEICEKTFQHVALVEILDITEKGSGVVNAFGKGARIKMVFFMGFGEVENGGKTMYKGIKKGDTFKGTASEKLCPNSKKTYFTISNYE